MCYTSEKLTRGRGDHADVAAHTAQQHNGVTRGPGTPASTPAKVQQGEQRGPGRSDHEWNDRGHPGLGKQAPTRCRLNLDTRCPHPGQTMESTVRAAGQRARGVVRTVGRHTSPRPWLPILCFLPATRAPSSLPSGFSGTAMATLLACICSKCTILRGHCDSGEPEGAAAPQSQAEVGDEDSVTC